MEEFVRNLTQVWRAHGLGSYGVLVARTRRHDADAGGPAEIVEAKHVVRQRVWDALRDEKIARFPGAHGRIPNFVGAQAAAERLRETDVWKQARTLKCNPDSAQWPVRQRALEDGKTVYMAVPRLAEEAPFFLLDPDDLDDTPRKASSIKGASRSGRTVAVSDLEPVDLVVTTGVSGATGEIPVTDHDVRLDLLVTPDRVVTCTREVRHPGRIVWDELTEEKIAAIPLLRRLRPF